MFLVQYLQLSIFVFVEGILVIYIMKQKAFYVYMGKKRKNENKVSHTNTERERERNNKQVVRVSGNGIVETRVVVRKPGQYKQWCCRAPIGGEWDIVVTVSI